MPPLEGTTYAGTQVQLAYEGDRPTLLFVFAAECGACTATWPTWQTLREGAQAIGVRMLFIDVTGQAGDEYLAAHTLAQADVLRYTTSKVVHLYRLELTPQVVLLDKAGVVLKVWIGGVSARGAEEVLAAVRDVAGADR